MKMVIVNYHTRSASCKLNRNILCPKNNDCNGCDQIKKYKKEGR